VYLAEQQTGYGTLPLPDSIARDLPGLAWTVPDLEAYARIEMRNVDNGTLQACLQAVLSNGLSAEQTAVKWATGIFTLVAILVGLLHACINSPSPAQYRWFDVVLLFQTAVAVGLMPLNFPLVYRAFTRNFFWAVGMVHDNGWQNSINDMRNRTGGSLSGELYPDTTYITRQLSPIQERSAININQLIDTVRALGPLLGSGGLFGRGLEARDSILLDARDAQLHSFAKRADVPELSDLNVNPGLALGVPTYTNSVGVPVANAFTTLFFVMLIVIAVAIALHLVILAAAFISDRAINAPNWGGRLKGRFGGFVAGNSLRLCLLFFLPVWIFGIYQFRIGDSKLAIFFAAFSMALTFLPLLAVFIVTVIRGRRISPTAPGVSPLYTSYRSFHSMGVLYRQYRQRFHFFWFIIVLALIARAGFIALSPTSGWAAVIGNMVVEAIIFVALIACRPHKDRKGDWLAPVLSFFRLAAFGLCIAFIPSVTIDPIPRTIIGFVVIVMFGLPAILLFFGLIFNAGYGYLWRRHTHRIEDGLEVERFSASDNDSQRPAMRQHVDANNFVSANNERGLDESRNTSGNSLNRRTSVMEPVGNTYGGNRSSRYTSGTQGGQDYEAYDAAASGGHGLDEGASRPTSAFERRQTRGNGQGYY
jgi:hypothetical protein